MWSSRARTRQRGLTLLEVLAAVALLGIVFTALSRSAALGVLSEGDSRRLLEASLLADSRLAAFELGSGAGLGPEPGSVTEEHGDFTLRIETRPFPLPDVLMQEREQRISTRSEVFGDGTELFPGIVLEVHLTVEWSDGVRERSIERTTFAVDYAAFVGGDALLLPGLLSAPDLLDAAQGALPEGEGATR